MATDRPRVLILHHAPPQTAGAKPAWRESDAGVLVEARVVAAALDRLRLPHRTVGVARLADLPRLLAGAPEDVVFNLVESFDGAPEDATLVPAVCRAHGKGCTGSGTPCLALTLDKWRTKAVLRAAGLPCPEGTRVGVGERIVASRLPAGPYIVKPVGADASEGIDARSVVARAGAALVRAVGRIHREFAQPALVEQFIAGREIDVSLLDRGGAVEVLPLAEIDFSAFSGDRPRIVGYAAKWLDESFEYRHTPQVIPARLPARRAEVIRRLARAAWAAAGCRGYARVDFRLDARGRPHILEINANPDVSPDAGFAAALAAAGILYEDFVGGEVRAAFRARGRGRLPRGPARAGRRTAARARIRRSEPRDRQPILALLDETRFFRDDELAVAREVLDDALAKGPGGHYHSFVAEQAGRTAGWACFGPTPCTIGTFDIYWIAVSPARQGLGLGTALMARAEREIASRGGRMAVVETSSRPVYDPTRRFYLACGYREAARLPHFYAPGDDKIVYTKDLAGDQSCNAT